MKYKIYVLKDPNDLSVKYVGCTINPKIRFMAHLSGNHNIKKSKWIEKLKSQSQKPVFEIVSERSTPEEAAIEEQRVYSLYNSDELFNYDPNKVFYKHSQVEKLVNKPIRISEELYNLSCEIAKIDERSFSSLVTFLLKKYLSEK